MPNWYYTIKNIQPPTRKIKVSYLVQTSWSGNGRIFCRTVVAIRNPIIGTMVIYCSCKGFLFVEQKAISASFVGQGSVGAFEKSIAGSGVRVQLKAKRFRTTAFLHKRKIELLGLLAFVAMEKTTQDSLQLGKKNLTLH